MRDVGTQADESEYFRTYPPPSPGIDFRPKGEDIHVCDDGQPTPISRVSEPSNDASYTRCEYKTGRNMRRSM